MWAGKTQYTEATATRQRSGDGLALSRDSLSEPRATETADAASRRQIRNLIIGLVGIFLAYKYGMSEDPRVLSALCLPDSVLLCCLLFTPPRSSSIYPLFSLPVRFYFVTHW